MTGQLEQRVETLEKTLAHILQRLEAHSELHHSATNVHVAVMDCLTEIVGKIDIPNPFTDGKVVKFHRLDGVSCVVCHGDGCEFCPVTEGSSGMSADQ